MGHEDTWMLAKHPYTFADVTPHQFGVLKVASESRGIKPADSKLSLRYNAGRRMAGIFVGGRLVLNDADITEEGEGVANVRQYHSRLYSVLDRERLRAEPWTDKLD